MAGVKRKGIKILIGAVLMVVIGVIYFSLFAEEELELQINPAGGILPENEIVAKVSDPSASIEYTWGDGPMVSAKPDENGEVKIPVPDEAFPSLYVVASTREGNLAGALCSYSSQEDIVPPVLVYNVKPPRMINGEVQITLAAFHPEGIEDAGFGFPNYDQEPNQLNPKGMDTIVVEIGISPEKLNGSPLMFWAKSVNGQEIGCQFNFSEGPPKIQEPPVEKPEVQQPPSEEHKTQQPLLKKEKGIYV